MATRMQQRRGTAAQWISTNSGNGPILNAGEIGYETDTNKFKIGDGTNHWINLDYFIDASSTVNPAFGSSITFEGATANDFETTLAVTDPTADRTITFPDATGTVALTSDISELSQDAVDAALTAGTGITKTYNDGANTLTLAVDTTTIQARVTDVSDTEIGYLNGVTSAIQTQLDAKSTESKTETLTNKTLTSPVINTPTGITKTDVGLANVDNTTDANKPVSTATQTALDLKANLSGPTFTGTISAAALTLSGDLTVNGTTTTINSTTLAVDDKNIVLGDVATPSDVTADGGGITLKGATDKTFNWVDATDSWTSSEHVNLASGKSLYLNGTLLKDATETLTNKTLTSPKINEDVALTSTATELNILDGATLSTAELNYVDGVTSAIQTQLDAKIAKTDITAKGAILVGTGSGTYSAQSVGTNGQVLTANSAQEDGVEWTTIAGYSAPTLGSTSIASGATVTTIAGLTLTAPTLTGTVTASGDINLSAAGGPGSLIDELTLLLMGAL
jgi:hypothetical protein